MCCQILLRCFMLCAQAVPAVQLAEGVLAHCYGCMHMQLRLGCSHPHCVFVCACGSHPASCRALWALGAAVPLLSVCWLIAPAVPFAGLCVSTTVGPVCVADLTRYCVAPVCAAGRQVAAAFLAPAYPLSCPFACCLSSRSSFSCWCAGSKHPLRVQCRAANGPVCGPAFPGRLFVDCTCVFMWFLLILYGAWWATLGARLVGTACGCRTFACPTVSCVMQLVHPASAVSFLLLLAHLLSMSAPHKELYSHLIANSMGEAGVR